MSAAPPPYKKAVGEGEICSQSVTLRKRHCLFFFAFGRAGEGLAGTRGLWKKWKARFENLDIKQGLPIAIYIACVTSVSARVRRERWDESKKKGMTGKGEGTVILHRDMENSVFPLLPSPSPFHFVFFAPAPTFALKLDWKRLLRRLPFIFFKVWLKNWLEGVGFGFSLQSFLTNAELRNANFRRNARAVGVKPSLHTKDWYYGLSKIWTVDCLTRGRGSKCLEHLQPIMDWKI